MERRIDLNHLLFLGAYLICMADALLIGLAMFGALNHASTVSLAMRTAAAAIVVVKLFVDYEYSVGSLMYIACTGVLLSITYLLSGYNHVFYLLLFVLGVRNIDIRFVVRVDLFVRIGLIVLILFCGATGIIENYITYRAGSSELRYSMGFNHPNTLASLVLLLILEEAWMNRRTFSVIYMICIWLAGGLVYLVTLNRTAVLLIFLFPLMLLLVGINAESPVKRWKARLLLTGFILAAAISFLAMNLIGDRALFGLLDRLMSNRFANAAQVYRQYGIPLLGQKVNLVSVRSARELGVSMAVLDNAYLRMLIQAGPLVLALMAGMYMRAVWQAWGKNDRITMLIMGMFVLFGLSESGANNVFMNFSLLIMAKSMFTSDQNDFDNTLEIENDLAVRRVETWRYR